MPMRLPNEIIEKMDNDRRRQQLPPYEILAELGLEREDVAADIGAGIGYFTIPMAESVKPTNKVYALDISEDMLFEVERRAQLSDRTNVVCLHTEEFDLKLPSGLVSFCLAADVLSDIKDKVRLLAEVRRISKPGARLAVIEELIPENTGIAQDDLRALLKSAGWSVSRELCFGDRYYAMVGTLDE